MSASRNSRFRAVQSSGKLLVWRSAQQAVCFRFPGRWPEARTRDAQFKPSKANSIFSPPNPSSLSDLLCKLLIYNAETF
jgi:hypothetical protein